MELSPGTRIDRYVLLEPLGEGGQGAVWKAEDPLHPDRPCALKLVELKHSRPTDAERVRREARALTRLEHPSLVRCYGLFEELRRDMLGVAMELVDGASLRHVRDDARFGPEERAALLRHIARALAYVHDQGVVHRDLKPDNILVSSAFFEHPAEPSTVKLVDFGIAAEEGNPQPLTALNSVVGTLAFLAPEIVDPSYFKAPGSTPAVDVFAFGVLAWQLLVGAGHPTGLRRASLVEYGLAYRRAAEMGAEWPAPRPEGAWGELLQRCLAVRAESRIANGTELSASCDLAARTGAVVRPEPAPGSMPASAPTAVASPAAMVGNTAAQSDAGAAREPTAPTQRFKPEQPTPPTTHFEPRQPTAPTEQLGPKQPTGRIHERENATSVSSGGAPAKREPTEPPRTTTASRRTLSIGLTLLLVAGVAATFAVLRDLGPSGSSPAGTARALPVVPPRASTSAPEPSASAPPAMSGVPVFSPTSALPTNCDHDAGICACCPSGRDCGPGVCGDSLEVDQSWLLRVGTVRSDARTLPDARVCVTIEGFGTETCATTDGGDPSRIHVDTPDLVDRGFVVEVQAAGERARTSVKRYDNGLKRDVLCSGLSVTGFEGALQVDSVRLFLDPDPTSVAAADCPAE